MNWFRRKWRVRKTTTVQVGNRLIILDGYNPLRYVDLAKNKLHKYRKKSNKLRGKQ